MSGSSLTIGVLLPEVLGTYADAANAAVLSHRAHSFGIAAQVLRLTADSIPAASCDLYLLGGGEDIAQQFAVSWLRRFPDLLQAVESRAFTLAVCAGMQILGSVVVDPYGKQHAGLGLLDLTTAAGRKRAVGEVVSSCALPGVGLLTGFENHRGVTTLGRGVPPLGRVLTGVGNGAAIGSFAPEGALTDRIIATYLHGPVLARNPALADHILRRVTGQDLPELELHDQAALRCEYLRMAGHRSRRARAWSDVRRWTGMRAPSRSR